MKHLSQDFDSKVLDLVKQNGFSPFEYTSDLGNFNKTLPSKNAFYSSSLSDREISVCVAQHVLKVWSKFEMKMTKNYHDLYLKCIVLLLPYVFEKIRRIRCQQNCGLCASHYFI